MQNLQDVQRLLNTGLCQKLGITIVSLSAHDATATMPVESNTQPHGLLHGGASIALAETLISLAGQVHAQALHGESAAAVGTSFSATHHAPARKGLVTAHVQAEHLGKRTATYIARIKDEDGTAIGTVLGSVKLLATPL